MVLYKIWKKSFEFDRIFINSNTFEESYKLNLLVILFACFVFAILYVRIMSNLYLFGSESWSLRSLCVVKERCCMRLQENNITVCGKIYYNMLKYALN